MTTPNDKLPEIAHLKAEVKRLNESCHQYSTRCIHLLQQAQRMADALEEIINALSGINDTVTNDIARIAEKAIQQFKDGTKGKGNEG